MNLREAEYPCTHQESWKLRSEVRVKRQGLQPGGHSPELEELCHFCFEFKLRDVVIVKAITETSNIGVAFCFKICIQLQLNSQFLLHVACARLADGNVQVL